MAPLEGQVRDPGLTFNYLRVSRMYKPRAVIFDFDFTLANPLRGTVLTVNSALAQLGLGPYASPRIAATIGLSSPAIFRELTGLTDSELEKNFAQAFAECADRLMDPGLLIYDAVYSVVECLRQAEVKMAIVSTKFRYRISNILRTYGLSNSFGCIVGGEDVRMNKPAPEGITSALMILGIPASDAVYVGDHVIDAQTASNAGVSFIATLTGVCLRDQFQEYPYLAIIDHLHELPTVLGIQCMNR
jgi:phosphoglycolate phosphatase